MKKLFAVLLTLSLLGNCTFVMAEEPAEELEIAEFAFDPASVEGIDGEFMGLEEFGLQFFVPSDFVYYEPSESDTAKGVISVMGNEEGSVMLSISYAGVADAEGNLITNLVDLGLFYQENGISECGLIISNGLECLTYYVEEPTPYSGMAYCTLDNAVLAFNVATAEGEEYEALSSIILASIMAMEETAEEEVVEEVTE